MRTWRFFCGAALVLLLGVGVLRATTWAPQTVKCPICGTPNKFVEIMSYGSYIYRWPSKFQYVFWPRTESASMYSCSSCRLTCFMWDFRSIPEDKREAIRKKLEGVTFDKKYADYRRIPMSQKLTVAEKVYSLLDKDDRFWCDFHRIKGYHLVKEKKPKEAADARKKSLALAEKLLKDKKLAGQKKELLLISGAMRHCIDDNKGALRDFNEALKLTYKNDKIKKENAEGLDKYLTGLLKEYIARIESGRKAIPTKPAE